MVPRCPWSNHLWVQIQRKPCQWLRHFFLTIPFLQKTSPTWNMPRSIEERNDFPTTILFFRYMFQVLLGKYWDFFFPKQWLIDKLINLNCFGHLQRSGEVAMKFTIFDYLRCTSTTKEYMYPICGIARYSWLFRDMSQLDLKKNTPSQLHKKYRNTKCYLCINSGR